MHITRQRGRVPWSVDYAGECCSNCREAAYWEAPNSVKDVRSFLGFANCYRQFVPSYAGIASPLTLLTKKNIEWHWDPIQRRAFSELKSALCNTPLLVFPDPKLPYTVVTDASVDALGEVLMQDQGDGLRPVAFMSQALKPTKQ